MDQHGEDLSQTTAWLMIHIKHYKLCAAFITKTFLCVQGAEIISFLSGPEGRRMHDVCIGKRQISHKFN